MMPSEPLVPVDGCWVSRRGTKEPLGIVLGRRSSGSDWQLRVNWAGKEEGWVGLKEVQSGFQNGWTVQDVPLSAVRKPLGPGCVVGRRRLGGREHLLVQLEETGDSVWLPYENLRRIKDVRQRFLRSEVGPRDHAERFRLKLLAHALENWNLLTGSLDRLDVDPLPHQIQLVHRILTSGNHNWLIADDVGLGKTIEVGLLLAALKRQGLARRILVVCPAGLTRQWQDEMHYKFGETYEIYGSGFRIERPEHWKIHDHVIVSIDLAKREEHMQGFAQAGGWDIVIFDESHKLTRYASGERADRYRLAEMLRRNADAFLLLSGTPHQGYTDRFIGLLELVRPDLRSQIHALEANPDVVAEMILRNRKSEVTDAEGNFIFKGQRVHRVAIEPSPETMRFQRLLGDYLRRGYKVGEGLGATGRAIGFVMTTYRKLASSSIAAIERALRLRLERLANSAGSAGGERDLFDLESESLLEGGDEQDNLETTISGTSTKEFFDLEADLLHELLDYAAVVRRQDEKLRIFMDEVVRPTVSQGKKLLIFTEYRATQSYLEEALEREFGGIEQVALINGSMKLQEKLDSIAAFNGPTRFLISTEAGGEGINLQDACHIMVNYDLPWNPARLVQRIGRLYRYGQQETVIVFNLHARDSFDNQAIDLMLQRVSQLVQDMAPVGDEYNDRLHAEILGELLESIDFASVLQSAQAMQISRTRDQIEDALDRARRARSLQEEIFAHIPGYDPEGLRGTLGLSMGHVNLFLRGMLPLIGASILEMTHGERVLDIRLPEELRGRFPEFANRTVVRVTTDRRLAQRFAEVVLLDFETEFFLFLIETAKSHEFDGRFAAIASPAGTEGAVAAFKLRWQNDQGTPLVEEFMPVFRAADGAIQSNPSFLVEWLTTPLGSAYISNSPAAHRARLWEDLLAVANRRLGDESSRFKHPNGLVPLAAADCRAAS